MTPPAGNDHVLVLLHSVVADHGVLAAAEHLVAGDAVVRLLRVVPRTSAFYQVLSPVSHWPDDRSAPLPQRIIATGDDMAATLLDLSRELQITLLAIGEPPPGDRRPRIIRRVLSKVLVAGSTPVLYVPPGVRGPRDSLRRILLVLHSPFPAYDLADAVVPLARRSHAEVMILTLPSADPVRSGTLSFTPFDATAWLERECARRGCRTRLVSAGTGPAKSILERVATLEVDLVIAGVGLAELRVGWRRRRMMDLVFPRLPCPLLFGRSA